MRDASHPSPAERGVMKWAALLIVSFIVLCIVAQITSVGQFDSSDGTLDDPWPSNDGGGSPRRLGQRGLSNDSALNAVDPSVEKTSECEDEDLHATTHERLNPFSEEWDNSSVICALMRLEKVADIREWLQYHRHIGVDHVMLFDNNEDEGKQASLFSDFIDDGFLSYHQIYGESLQLRVYEVCVQRAKKEYAWMAAIDMDEFIVVKDPEIASQPKPLKLLLNSYRFFTGLWIQWITFGPSGHETRPPVGGPLKHYQKCIRTQTDINLMGKSIVNTFWLKKGSHAHGFLYRGGSPAYSDTGIPLPPTWGEEAGKISGAYARINRISPYIDKTKNTRVAVHHYSTRSREDFNIKQLRGAGDHPRNVTFRADAFFEKRQKYERPDPSCRDAARIADECCYKDGVPFPPVPVYKRVETDRVDLDLDADGVERKWTFRSDNCTMKDSSGKNPYTKRWSPSIAMCVHLDDFTWSSPDFREWIAHHKNIGIEKILFFTDQRAPVWKHVSTRQVLMDAIQSDFALLQEIDSQGHRHLQREGHEACVADYADDYSHLAFLHLGDYILLRDHNTTLLPMLLETPTFRYNSGVVLPMYHFAERLPGTSHITPLGSSNSCWKTEAGSTRMIANTQWLIETEDVLHFRFRGDLVPVTDSNRKWALSTAHWELPGISKPLNWNDSAYDALPRNAAIIDPLVDMGSLLAVVARDGSASVRKSRLGFHSMNESQWNQEEEAVCSDVATAFRLLNRPLDS